MRATHHTGARRHSVAVAVALVAALIVPVSAAANASTAPPPAGGTYTVYAAPTKINAGASSWFAMGVLNNGSSTLGSFRVAMPPGFVPQLPFGAALTPRGAWDLTLQTCTGTAPAPCAGAGTYVIQADARRTDGGDALRTGEGLAFLFQATAGTVGGVYPWQTAATSARLGAGTALTPPATPRTITVISNAATALVISGVPGDPVAGTAAVAHDPGRRRVRQHRHRLPRHGPLLGDPRQPVHAGPCRLHVHRSRRRPAHLHERPDAHDGAVAELHGHRLRQRTDLRQRQSVPITPAAATQLR